MNTHASPDDTRDMFEELPRRVQVAILSNIQGLRSRPVIYFTEYPRPVAEMIEASGLMAVEWRSHDAVRFRANERTQEIRASLRAFLEIVGFEF